MAKYKTLTITEEEMSMPDIFRERKFNVFVASCPRSGSSVMGGVLERLGVLMVYTSDTTKAVKKRLETEEKRYGKDYQMNRDGFYEIIDHQEENFFKIMQTPYSGCKVIIPVSRRLMHVLNFNPGTRVIQMWRDPEEIRQSQQASYKGDKPAEDPETARAIIREKLVKQQEVLKENKIKSVNVRYQDLLDDPRRVIGKIAKFINAPNPIDEAVKWIDPSKQRFKKEELTKDI